MFANGADMMKLKRGRDENVERTGTLAGVSHLHPGVLESSNELTMLSNVSSRYNDVHQ